MTKEQRKVLKRFPNAKLSYDDNGYKVIMINLWQPAKDYFLPDTMDTDKAWEYASMACRTTQQFNRTHPLKVEIDLVEKKPKICESKDVNVTVKNQKNEDTRKVESVKDNVRA